MCITSMSKLFSILMQAFPLYCLTKRHDNEEEDLKLWTSPSEECLAITLVRSDKKITKIQHVKS